MGGKYIGRRHCHGQWQRASGQTFRQAQYVGHYTSLLASQQCAGASPGRHHFIGDEQDAMSRTDRPHLHEHIRQEKTGLWWARPFVIPTNRRRDIFVSSDGPYADQYTLAYKILGPMIGLYRPNPIS